MVEEIRSDKGSIIAILISQEESPEGVKFFTPSDFSQQVGLLRHKKGSIVKPHVHKMIERKVMVTQEVLHIKKGKIEVFLYDEDNNKIGSRKLVAGDTIILANAGHGIEVLEESLILEIKQGPYAGEDDKNYIGDAE